MRFLLAKEDKEKVMNKVLKSIKQSVKALSDNDYEGLGKACTEASAILYSYLYNNIDYGEDKFDED